MAKIDEWLEDDKLILLESWARDGLTYEQIANNVGIDTATLYRWREKNCNICNALKKGKEVVDIEVENALKKNAIGFSYVEQAISTEKEVIYENGKRVKEISKPVVIEVTKYKQPETIAQIFWLKNRKPDKWRDKVENYVDTQELTNVEKLLAKLEEEANK